MKDVEESQISTFRKRQTNTAKVLSHPHTFLSCLVGVLVICEPAGGKKEDYFKDSKLGQK